MERREMLNIVAEMYYEEETISITCEGCPFRKECEEQELWWGCGVWEDQMGDDL